MGENNSKWNNWQGIHFQNIPAAHTTQYQESKQPNQKVGERPKQTLLQRRYRWLIKTWKDAQHCSLLVLVQLLKHVRLFATPWITALKAFLSITNSRSSHRLTSTESVKPSSHLILCHPLLLLPPIPPSIRVFTKESTLRMRWPKYWNFSFASFLPKKSQGWSPLEWTGWISLQSKGLSRVFSNTTVQKHQFFGAQPSSQSNPHIHTWPEEKP